jgi:uncharacterized protein YcbK (DUF882 family)
MKKTDWSKVRHFAPSEFNFPDMLDSRTIAMLDAMRHEEGKTRDIIITINSDFDYSGHSSNSMHYQGKAFDLVIKDRRTQHHLPILDQFLIAVRYFWTGIGFYPYWNTPGLHVDTRPMILTGRRALWWRDNDGSYKSVEQYISNL